MRSKIQFLLKANGTLQNLTAENNKIFAGQVSANEYYLEIENGTDTWRANDVVFINFTRPDAKEFQLKATRTDTGWVWLSNGVETDVDISSNSDLIISWTMRRYSSLDGTTLVATRTTEEVTMTIYPASAYVPQDIDPDIAEILELNINNLQIDKVGRYNVADSELVYLPAEIVYDLDGEKSPNNFYYNFEHAVTNFDGTSETIIGTVFVTVANEKQIEVLKAENERIYIREVNGGFNEVGKGIYGDLNDKIINIISQLGDKQDKTDNSLQTNSKQVVGAINENKTNIENNYNVLNDNKLDKNFNLLVERTYAQLADFVAVRSGDQTLKMTLQTLRNYLTQGLVGLRFDIVDELPTTGMENIIYLVPLADSIEHYPTYNDLPGIGSGGGAVYSTDWLPEESFGPDESGNFTMLNDMLEGGLWVSSDYTLNQTTGLYEQAGTIYTDITELEGTNTVYMIDNLGFFGEEPYQTIIKAVLVDVNNTTSTIGVSSTQQAGMVVEGSSSGGGTSNVLYITDDNGARYQWDEDTSDYIAYSLGYSEHIWINEISAFEQIGTTAVDLTGYATEIWVNDNFVAKSVLNGGTTGQVLAKKSNSDLDVEWADIEIPTVNLNGVELLRDPAKTYLVIKTPADNDTFTLLTGSSGSPNYTIDWGDGTSESVTTTDNRDHTYATAGMYLITISGSFTNGIVVGNGSNTNKSKYIKVFAGSNYATTISGYAFYDCGQLTTFRTVNVVSVGIQSFGNCQKLTDFEVEKISTTDSRSFEGIVPYFNSYITFNDFNSLTSLGIGSFSGITSGDLYIDRLIFPLLTTINSNSGYPTFGIFDFINYIYMPKITTIGNRAFQNKEINKLIIGKSLTSIDSNAFLNSKIGEIVIVGDPTELQVGTIISAIKASGAIIGNVNIVGNLQVEKPPTLDNDVVRKTDLDAVKNLIPTTVNRYFTSTTDTIFSNTYNIMQNDKPTGAVTNINLNVTATSQGAAQVLARFTTADGIPSTVNLPAQNTTVSVQALRTAGTQAITLFVRGYVMDDSGTLTLLSTSNTSTLTNQERTYTFFLPIDAYTAPAGSRAVIEIMAYRASGSGTHTAQIKVDNDTMSRWSYNLSLADLKLDANNINYNNLTSGLTATNVQDAIDELASNETLNGIYKLELYAQATISVSDTEIRETLEEFLYTYLGISLTDMVEESKTGEWMLTCGENDHEYPIFQSVITRSGGFNEYTIGSNTPTTTTNLWMYDNCKHRGVILNVLGNTVYSVSYVDGRYVKDTLDFYEDEVVLKLNIPTTVDATIRLYRLA